MNAAYYADRMKSIETERNRLLAQAQPALTQISFLEGQLTLLDGMRQEAEETDRRLAAENETLRKIADERLGGISTGTLGPVPLPHDDDSDGA